MAMSWVGESLLAAELTYDMALLEEALAVAPVATVRPEITNGTLRRQLLQTALKRTNEARVGLSFREIASS